MKKLINKLKKINWIKITALIMFFLCTVEFFISSSVKIAEAETVNIYSDSAEFSGIHILEIEPGNLYVDFKDKDTYKDQTGKADYFVDGKEVYIKRIPMSSFISLSADINGDYDIIMLGRENKNLFKFDVEGKINAVNLENALKAKYTDYSPAFSNSRSYGFISDREVPYMSGNMLPFLPFASWQERLRVFSEAELKGKKLSFTEYMPENDITDKAAKKIISMIESGQLVYIDKNITEASEYEYKTPSDSPVITNTSSGFHDTKLYKNFAPLKDQDKNLKKDFKDFSIKEVVEEYMAREVKRPQIVSFKSSGGDNIINGSAENPSKNARQLRFNIAFDKVQPAGTSCSLFLDINADSLFSVNELAAVRVLGADAKSVNLGYTVNSDFIGYLDWKIEIKTPQGARRNIKGYVQFGSIGDAVKVKVLQVIPNYFYEDSEFNLSKNEKFLDIINNKDNKYPQINGYDIDIETISVNEFNEKVKNPSQDSDNEKFNGILNGQYNMLIIGFGDSYGNAEALYEGAEKSDFDLKSCEVIEDFIKTGQSVMFTHDTITPVVPKFKENEKDQWYISGPKLLTERMRDFIGQSRFPDVYRMREDGTIDESDMYKTYIKTEDNGKTTIKLENRQITHDDYSVKKDGRDAYILGNTKYGYMYKPRRLEENEIKSGKTAWAYIDGVKPINIAQITQYPFDLTKEFTDKDGMHILDVASTHTQWYQLNLEDPDVVPWFNLAHCEENQDSFGINMDTDDSRNNYYTYSKGNITYSGTGHSHNGESGYPESELKLFINTIIKAERGGNHAPVIDCSISSDYQNITENSQYDFTVNARDYDNDLVEMSVKINGQYLSSENINPEYMIDKTEFSVEEKDEDLLKNLIPVDTNASDRKPVKITVPADKIKIGEEIKVAIKARDIKGARTEKNYTLIPIKAPDFVKNIELNLDTENLKSEREKASRKKDEKIKIEDADEKVIVPYNAVFKPFVSGDSVSTKSEIAVLIDCYIKKTDSESTKAIRNELGNRIINDLYNLNGSNNPTVKIGLIEFGQYGSRIFDKSDQYFGDLAHNMRNIFDDYFFNGKFDDEELTRNETEDGETDLGAGIKTGIEYFNNNPQPDQNKTFVIISNRNVSEASLNEIKAEVKQNYSVITLDLSKDYYHKEHDPTTKEEHLELLNRHKGLRKAHFILGGADNDYFVSRGESYFDKDAHNDLQGYTRIIEKIADRIKAFYCRSYRLDNIKGKFTTGEDIDMVSGLDASEIKNLKPVKYIPKLADGKIITHNGKVILFPEIMTEDFEEEWIYDYDFIEVSEIEESIEKEDDEGNIKFAVHTSDKNNAYFNNDDIIVYLEPESLNLIQNFKFIIKASEKGFNSGKKELVFDSPNELEFNIFSFDAAQKTDADKTPVLVLNAISINQGLYKNIYYINGSINADFLTDRDIKPYSEALFSEGSYVTCAVNVKDIDKKECTFTLKIPDEIKIINSPKCYILAKENISEKLENPEGVTVDENLNIHINKDLYDNLCFIYTVKIPVTENKGRKDYEIKITSEDAFNFENPVLKLMTDKNEINSLPDLF